MWAVFRRPSDEGCTHKQRFMAVRLSPRECTSGSLDNVVEPCNPMTDRRPALLDQPHPARRVDIARCGTRLQQAEIVVALPSVMTTGWCALNRFSASHSMPTSSIEQDHSQLDFRRVFVSRQEIVGKRIRELNLENTMGATVTRLRRGDVNFVPTRDTRLELGDRIRVLTRRENFSAISRFFGDSIRGTAETDFGSVALGMVLGVLVGLVPIPLPGGTLRLGLAGGPLLVALILGKLERTGRVTWIMPLHSNLTLRQIGLVFFLAGLASVPAIPSRRRSARTAWRCCWRGRPLRWSSRKCPWWSGISCSRFPSPRLWAWFPASRRSRPAWLMPRGKPTPMHLTSPTPQCIRRR